MALARHRDDRREDDGLPAWILPVCLVLAALACFVMLRVTISVLSVEPPASPPATAPTAP